MISSHHFLSENQQKFHHLQQPSHTFYIQKQTILVGSVTWPQFFFISIFLTNVRIIIQLLFLCKYVHGYYQLQQYLVSMFACILQQKQVMVCTLQPSMLISQVSTLHLQLCNQTDSMYVYYKVTNVQVRTHEYDLITLPRVTTPCPLHCQHIYSHNHH